MRIPTLVQEEPFLNERFRRFLLISLGVHAGVIVLQFITLPLWNTRKVSMPPGIPIEMVAMTKPASPASKSDPGPRNLKPVVVPTQPPKPDDPEKPPKPNPVPTQPPPPVEKPATPPPPKKENTPVPDKALQRNTPKPVAPEQDEPTAKPKNTSPPVEDQPTREPKATKPPEQSWFEQNQATEPPKPQRPTNPAVVDAPERTTFESAPTGVASAGSLAVEDNFEYDYYITALMNAVQRNWTPRPGYLPAGTELITVIYFRISRDGHISGARIEQSCGKARVDEDALRAVQLSDPLPELPPRFDGSSVGIHFAFYLNK